ncbi:MAG: Tyrosine-tRNA ligase [Candidatus Gottesmanbacteria bacterium GW2011_GWA2_47_9]|uniref:Tyrosine--tRNA ligase n=1 Tax=Candidatus Gottesmanbacteria bacterium GW2011_GWA2_47_9 TaxID=1618445 RepID=A0A0G1TV18_9BACT|nr:MAG: Tyrosine-tRNA ligase [Candidatus Gottesmanbacteria bacterium GW2011_GWA2_47_9]
MDAIENLLTRGVDKIYPNREELEKVLRSGKKLRLYQGFDPTGTQLHIGHAVGFRKLRQWQDLGHEVIFLIGDGTGQAGDPSGKKTAREKFFTREELRQNGRDYVMQAGKIVRFDGPNPVKILYNGDWLNKLGLVEILDIAGHFTLQQMLERDLYQERLKSGVDLSLREFMYPLLQGYDSVAMDVDLELGGSDQMFNMLAGRKLVKAMLGKEKFVMTVPLLADSKGVKIGKTEGNVIGITDPPNDFFGKVMALGDDAIIPCFTLLTDTPMQEITEVKEKMAKGENGQTPTQADEFATSQTEWNPADLLVAANLAPSKSEAKRLIEQNAVETNGKAISPQLSTITLKNNDILRVGKKKFIKIHLT